MIKQRKKLIRKRIRKREARKRKREKKMSLWMTKHLLLKMNLFFRFSNQLKSTRRFGLKTKQKRVQTLNKDTI